MERDLHDFELFMKQREAAARAYVSGDAAPLGRIVTHTAPATFFGPKGGARNGPDEVFSTYQRDAAGFGEHGETHFEILHMAASGGIAYWVGYQRARARLRNHPEPVPMSLRVTEVFRREADTWKLIHRHADMQTVEQG
jgi:ketosteroid isomerase-like protein